MVLKNIILRLKKSLECYKTISPYIGNIFPIFFGIMITFFLCFIFYLLTQYAPDPIYSYRVILYIVFFLLMYIIWIYIIFTGLVKTKLLNEIIALNKKGKVKAKVNEKLAAKYKDTKFTKLVKRFPAYLLNFSLIPTILFILIGLKVLLRSITANIIIISILNYVFTLIIIALMPAFLDIITLPIRVKDYKITTKDIKAVIFNIITQFKLTNLDSYFEKLLFCFALLIIAYIVVLILSFVPALFWLLTLLFLSYTITSCTF